MITKSIISSCTSTVTSALTGFFTLYSYFFELIDSLTEKSGMPGTVTRDSAASYIDTAGVLQISDGDDTPFSHDSVHDETGYTDVKGSFADDQAWFDGAVLGSELMDYPTPSITNNTGSNGVWTSGTQTMSNTSIGENSSYPRFKFSIGLTTGSLYKISGRLSGDTESMVRVRLTGMGIDNDVSYDSATGIFGLCISAVENYIEFGFDGREVFDVAIESCSVKQVTASLADYAGTGNMLIIDDTSAKGYGFIGEAGTGETLGTNLFDQDGGSGGSGDKGAFTLADLRLAEVSSGNLTVGTMYEISAQDGEDFTADGAPDNTVGTTFVATGTNVTLDANDKVYPVDISWVPYGTNTMEIDDGALKISRVDSSTGAYINLSDATDFTDNFEAGKQYKLTGNVKVGSGDEVDVVISSGVSPYGVVVTKTIDTETYEPFELYYVATSTTGDRLRIANIGSGESIWLDSLQISEVTAPSATAVKIFKEYTLDNEGWNALDTGIDYNAAAWEFDVYQNLMFEYPDLVVNGGFDANTNWNKTNTVIAGGVATYSGAGYQTMLGQSIEMVEGRTYNFDVDVLVGSIRVKVGSATNGGSYQNYTGSTLTFVDVSGSPYLYIQSTVADVVLDNVQVAQTDSGAQPRFEANGLLSEGEGTNYCLQSNGFDTWTTIGVTETQNVTGPDGIVNSAWTLEDDANTTARVAKIGGVSSPISGTYTFSVFVKEGTSPHFTLLTYDVTASAWRSNVDFDWTSGIPVPTNNIGTGLAKQLGSTDWWRVEVFCPSIVAGNEMELYLTPTEHGINPGSPKTTIFYGAQFEPTPYATSYIPTTTIPVTRTADSHSWTMSEAFKNLMGNVADSPFTMVAEWTPKFDYGDTGGDISIIRPTTSNRSLLYAGGSGTLKTYDGSAISSVDPNYTANTTYLFALRVFDDAGTMKFEVGEKHGGSWTWDATPANYDSSFNPSDNFLIGYLNQYPFNIKNIIFFNSAKDKTWIEGKY